MRVYQLFMIENKLWCKLRGVMPAYSIYTLHYIIKQDKTSETRQDKARRDNTIQCITLHCIILH